MGFFQSLKDDLSEAVGELIGDEEITEEAAENAEENAEYAAEEPSDASAPVVPPAGDGVPSAVIAENSAASTSGISTCKGCHWWVSTKPERASG